MTNSNYDRDTLYRYERWLYSGDVKNARELERVCSVCRNMGIILTETSCSTEQKEIGIAYFELALKGYEMLAGNPDLITIKYRELYWDTAQKLEPALANNSEKP